MDKPVFRPYRLPSADGARARSVGNILRQEGVLASGPIALTRHNKVDGYQCNSCAWVKPANPLPFEFCENGVKAMAWELTAHRCTPDFFAKHTVTELLDWDEYELEQTGRLTHPLRYDAATDRYVPVPGATPSRRSPANSWPWRTGRPAPSSTARAAYRTRAVTSTSSSPGSTATTTCRTRPTCATRRPRWRLPVSIGQGIGTVSLDDFAKSDCILFFGQNPGSNSPRMLHPCRRPASAAYRSSPTTRCASAGWSGS